MRMRKIGVDHNIDCCCCWELLCILRSVRQSVTFLGHLAHIFLSFLTAMYLYDHMTLTHMTTYLYNRAILSETPLSSPFVCFLLFSPYGSL